MVVVVAAVECEAMLVVVVVVVWRVWNRDERRASGLDASSVAWGARSAPIVRATRMTSSAASSAVSVRAPGWERGIHRAGEDGRD